MFHESRGKTRFFQRVANDQWAWVYEPTRKSNMKIWQIAIKLKHIIGYFRIRFPTFFPFSFLFLFFSLRCEVDAKTEVKPLTHTTLGAHFFPWETAYPKSPQAAPPSAAPPPIFSIWPPLQSTLSRTSSGPAATTASSLRSRFFSSSAS